MGETVSAMTGAEVVGAMMTLGIAYDWIERRYEEKAAAISTLLLAIAMFVPIIATA